MSNNTYFRLCSLNNVCKRAFKTPNPNEPLSTLIYSYYLISHDLTMYGTQWRQEPPGLTPKSQLCATLPSSVFSACTLVTSYWPWWECLHNGNGQTTNQHSLPRAGC